MSDLIFYYDKFNIYLNNSFNDKKVISFFQKNNFYEYVCLTNLDIDDDEFKIKDLEKFLKKYKYVYNHGKFVNEDKSIILPSIIIFNPSDDDIEFICRVMNIKYFYRSKITNSGDFYKPVHGSKKKFEKF